MEKKIKDLPRINHEITNAEVLLIDEKGQKLGKVNIDQARLLAYEKDLDLVEVAGNVHPPVCKLIDYNKLQYRKNKQIQKQKSKQKVSETKEIKLSLNIGEHDFQVKVERAKEFLAQGHKVKTFLILKGRERMFFAKAMDIINNFKNFTGTEFDQPPKRLGNTIFSIIKTKK